MRHHVLPPLKVIGELKEKAKWDDRLEATQLKKIEGKADI